MTHSPSNRQQASPGASATRQVVLWILLSGAIVGAAFSRIYTVATGVADIMHYYQSALDILAAPTWASRLEAAFSWAPLHPLLLAATIQWLGAEWTFCLNPILSWGLLAGIGVWGWMAMRDSRYGVLTALAGAACLLFGFPSFAHDLLYPYREALTFFFLYFAMISCLLAYPAGGGLRRTWLLAAGCGYVLAATVREPAIMALPGALVYVVAQPRKPVRARLMDLTVLMAPLLMAFLAMAILHAQTGILGSRQFVIWRIMSSRLTLAAWWGMYGGYLRWLYHLLGFWGTSISVLGLVAMARQNRPAVLLLLVSLLSTVGMYATFRFYPRYALSAAIFIVPFLGAGLRAIALSISRMVGQRRRWLEQAPHAVMVAVLLGFCAVKIASLQPWGGVSRAQLRMFTKTINVRVAPQDRILIDPRSRLLYEVLKVHLGLNPWLQIPPLTASSEDQSLVFFQPSNENALIQAQVKVPPVSMEMDLLRHADLKPVCDDANQAITLMLGRGEYALCRVQPWKQRRAEQTLSTEDIAGGLFWLDFQQSDAGAAREVRIEDKSGNVLARWLAGQGNGLIPFFTREALTSEVVRLIVESSAPLPQTLIARPRMNRGQPWFSTADGRRPSILDWIAPPAILAPEQKWAAAFTDAAKFIFPAPRGAEGASRLLSVWLEPNRRQSGTAIFRYRIEGHETFSWTNRLDRGLIRHEVAISVAGQEEHHTLLLEVETPTGSPRWFRVAGLGLQVREQD